MNARPGFDSFNVTAIHAARAEEREAGLRCAAIVDAVASRFDVTGAELRGESKSIALTGARHAACWMLSEIEGMGPCAIGRVLNQTSQFVGYGLRRTAWLLERGDGPTHDLIAGLRRELARPAPAQANAEKHMAADDPAAPIDGRAAPLDRAALARVSGARGAAD